MIIKALTAKGFSIALPPTASGEGRDTFRVSTLNGTVFIPDDLARTGKAAIDQAIADGLISLEADSGRLGFRGLRVEGADLGFSTTPNALDLSGEPIQAVIHAHKVTGTTLAALIEDTDFEVVDGEVFMLVDHSAAAYAIFFVQN